jgi:hypothetical protein
MTRIEQDIWTMTATIAVLSAIGLALVATVVI